MILLCEAVLTMADLGTDRVVIQSQGETNNQPCPVVDLETQTVWLTFCRNNQHVFAIKSQDDGATWSSPIEITEQVKDPDWHYIGTGPGHGIQLKSGRLLIPSWADTSRDRSLGEIMLRIGVWCSSRTVF